MPAGNSVRPIKWGNVIDIYDNGLYSAIWGNYDNSPNRCLGVRWNGAPGGLGYPNGCGYPTWYVEPEFLTKLILLQLLDEINKDNSLGNMRNILVALQECP
ncbi:hypothetical protein Barb4_03820 [Bacteroidales bacterium Barb4]|nr:hypothetical protein Barb4_03820 [Bacteroidales bacterium Barb4]